MRYMRVVYFVTAGLCVFGLVSFPIESDHVVTQVGHNAVISLNVSQSAGEYRVGVEVNNDKEYFFVKLNNTNIQRVNNSRTWYRVQWNITSSVFRLTLYNVTTEDAGIYACWKTDMTNQRVPGCEQLLIVAQNPSQPNITRPASAVSGWSVTLTCSSSSRSLPLGHPPLTMTYTWRRNSEEIVGGGDVPVDGPNLTVRDISREKNGIYTCQAVEEGLESDWSHGHVLDVQSEPAVSNVVSTAVICSVLVVLVAVVLAILLYRHKAKKGKRPYRVGADKEDQLQQDPSHLYSKVNKRKRAGREVYEPVKLDSPRQFMNRMYGARPSSERMVLINNSDHNPGVTNNCGKRNEDGLIYADLDLVQPTLVDGMPIIHSREEPVVYEEIDFFLTPGPQLPDKIWEVEEEDDDCW